MSASESSSPTPPPPRREHATRSYGKIARLYSFLEYAAFGRDLERTRSAFIDRLGDCTEIAVFGAGDGRCFLPLLSAAPSAKFVSIEADPEMMRLARRLVANLGATDRVEFVEGDARNMTWEGRRFDAALTQFFLDCFGAEDLDRLIPRIAAGLRPGARWFFADFAIPERPALARWRARAWIAALCLFFRWQAGHALKTLPPMEPLLRKHGLRCEVARTRSWGLLRAAVYRK